MLYYKLGDDMAQNVSNNRTARNKFTRMCIGEAIVSLMKNKEYEKIKVSEIVEEAAVSRMTYYHYYETKLDAINDYFHEIIDMYMDKCVSKGLVGKFHCYENIRFALEFFDDYAGFFSTLNGNGLYSVLIEGMNKYMVEHFSHMYADNESELYYYAGGLLNVFIKWQENGKKQTADEIAHIIEKMW